MTTTATTIRPAVHRQRLLDRFLEYVQIETTSDPTATTYPSSPGQLELGKLLVSHLRSLGLFDAFQDSSGLVWGTIPATDGGGSATVALLAHLDTSPESPGSNVRPRVIPSYAGGDIELGNEQVIRQRDTPELEGLRGKTLITTDGTTLLGGDDKAGVAILVELAAHLMEHPYLPHGEIRLLFTCDEEIGRGTEKIDLKQVNALVAYTLDGGGAGQLDVETFSADSARVSFHGTNIHPAIAKGRMVNAVRAASDFVDRLPRATLAPESTEGREPFLHPYAIEGSVASASVQLLLRSFDTAQLVDLAEIIRQHAAATAAEFPGIATSIEIQAQYRNLRDGLRHLPEAIELAKKGFANLGRRCEETIIRGGTDGSQLTEKGLPTPNLSSGQYNIHSLKEFACLDEMVEAVEHLVELLSLWSDKGRS